MSKASRYKEGMINTLNERSDVQSDKVGGREEEFENWLEYVQLSLKTLGIDSSCTVVDYSI